MNAPTTAVPNEFPADFKASSEYMDILKELIVTTAMNESGYRLGIIFTPYVLHSEKDATCCLLQMQVSMEALAPVHRMAKMDEMKISFAARSIGLKQSDPGIIEAQYFMDVSGIGENIVDDIVNYAIDDSSSLRQSALAAKDIFEFLMHGTLKGEPIGD